MKDQKKNRQKGITLIALVVTIVVLIILATVSILAVFGDNGIIARAERAKELHETGKADETNTLEGYDEYIDNYIDGIKATIDGKKEKITRNNVSDYLGKVVTNYVPTASSVTIDGTAYTVSTKYRLYYVDFDGKYGEKNGVYLKADGTSERYELPTSDKTLSTASNIKIRELNPALYANGVTAPNASNDNMKAVTWLLNTTNWDSLKTGASLANKVNYVVGAPSVEMMMDSYNTKYGLTNETMNTDTLDTNSPRVKLFYQYPTTLDSNNYGYEVGPSNNSLAKNGYWYLTSDYSVKSDSTIDSMYYPASLNKYWLASPSSAYNFQILSVTCSNWGYVDTDGYSSNYGGHNGFCPLVSLQSSVVLELL